MRSGVKYVLETRSFRGTGTLRTRCDCEGDGVAVKTVDDEGGEECREKLDEDVLPAAAPGKPAVYTKRYRRCRVQVAT